MAFEDHEAHFARPCPKPCKPSDGEGLHLLMQPNGARLWRMKYRPGQDEAPEPRQLSRPLACRRL